MAKRFPERPVTDTTIRDEGSVFHKVFYHEALGFNRIPAGEVINDIEVDDFMATSAVEAAEFVRAWGCRYWLEEPLDCSLIHPSCGGTADAIGIDLENKIIHVFDPKYGFRPIHGFRNFQMGCYVAGIIKRFGVDGGLFAWGSEDWTIVMTIYQPRLPDKFKSWTLTVKEYCEGMFEELRTAATMALGDGKHFRSGVHCYRCPGAANCAALRADCLNSLDVIEAYEEKEIDAQTLSFELDLLDRANKVVSVRKEALEIEAHWRLMGGEGVPGYILKNSPGRIQWKTESKNTVVELAKLMNLGDISRPAQPLPVRQAEKIVGTDFIKQHTHTPQGALKLKRLTEQDIRQAFDKQE